jgi:predicted metalloprotease with PDZ domain
LIVIGICNAFLVVGQFTSGLPACADTNQDAIKLYNERQYRDALSIFEKNNSTTWTDPTAAYYYALTLNALGKTKTGLEVCREISQRFPRSKAAIQSKVAIERWSHNIKSIATAPSEVGIVGMKFLLAEGRDPEITAIFPGTPAEKAGLCKGDAIMSIDDVSTKGLSKDQIFNLLVGAPDSIVRVSIRREQNLFNVALKRMHSNDFAKAQPDIWKDYLKSM